MLYDPAGMRPQCTFIVHWHSCRLDAGHKGAHSPGRAGAASTEATPPPDVLARVYEDGMRAGIIAGWAGQDFEAAIAEVNALVMDTDTEATADAIRALARASTEATPPTEPVYLYWSEYDDSATVKGWGGDNIYKCRECPEWEGDSDSAPRHSALHRRPSTEATPRRDKVMYPKPGDRLDFLGLRASTEATERPDLPLDRQRLHDEYLRGYRAAAAMVESIEAIERAAAPPLDVERLRAMLHKRWDERRGHLTMAAVDATLDEYARLGSAPSTEEAHRGD